MVVQVGDKVLVYGAGTSWGFAKKIEPLKVGDKVDVVTLSDGTKLAMPKIELDTGEYVWVVPEWDSPFNIGDVPFQWGMMPLGAAVFTLTDIIDCTHVEDSNRDWGDNFSLAGYYMAILSGENRGWLYKISSHQGTTIYTIVLAELFPDVPFVDWTYSTYSVPGRTTSTVTLSNLCHVYCASNNMYFATATLYHAAVTVSGAETITIPVKLLNTYPAFTQVNIGGGFSYNLNNCLVRADSIFSADELTALGLAGRFYVNPDYPDFTEVTINYSGYYSGPLSAFVDCAPYSVRVDLQLGPLTFNAGACASQGLAAGDTYVIYDPVTKRLVFNDAAKTVLASASWRDIVYPGEVVTLPPVEYVWDGQGYVYLSQSKTTLSTIFYDNELRVEAYGDNTPVQAIDYHSNDPYTYSGETVSRELVNITSILRAGKNFVQIKARDTGGNKIGFPTPVYIMRSMS